MSKLLLVSIDQNLTLSSENITEKLGCGFELFNSNCDPLEVVSQIFSTNPSLLILDDDFLSPETLRLLVSLKKVKPELPIITITSNNDIKLGRSINNIGVKYYLIKPLIEENLKEYIQSIYLENKNNIYKSTI